MTYGRVDGPSAVEFRQARKEWIEGRIQDLADALESAGPDLYELLPADLGELRLAAALTVVRVAADEARTQPVAETVHWLERLIPGGHRHDLAGVTRALRSRLAAGGEPAVWSWNAAAWEELALWWWRRHQPANGDPEQDFTEWRSRWSAEIPRSGGIDEPEQAPRRHGRALLTPAEFFASEPEPLRLLAHAVLRSPRTLAAVEDAVLLREEHLQGAGHLRWLAEQQACADQLEAWRRSQQETGSEATRAFLAELSEAVKRYATLVLQPVVEALSAAERALLDGSRPSSHRTAVDYLDVFLDWQRQPDADAWTDEAVSADVARQARERRERGEATWQGMRGSMPVWYHIVASPQEKAAALAYSGRPSASVVRVRTGGDDVTVPGLSLFEGLFDETDESADWYPEPGIDVPYDPDSAFDLCALLALAQLGHARLEFLTIHPEGAVRTLRAVRALVREDDAKAYRRWALAGLAEAAPDPEDLADLMARDQEEDTDESGETGGPEGADPQAGPDGAPSAGPDAPSPGRRTTGGSLPPELLGKVKALLRKAEDGASTEEEARAFLAKATELMAKYGIEQAMLDDLEAPVGPLDRVVEVHPPYAKEMRRLLSWIAEAMRCRSVYPGGKVNRMRVHLFGFEPDVQASEVLFASLRLQMLDGADRADRLYRPAGEDARAYKRSWMLGFIREVTDRVKAAQETARAAAQYEQEGAGSVARSVALVLSDRSTVVDARMNDRYPALGKSRPTKFKGTGYRQGRVDGRRADIGGQTDVPGTRTEQLAG
ncbi:DUF2786 domain-containing protein [Streptomyces erythrochromogenes]|uniref:DUF2786 domain-containing protein n=1 Tax=Streptomyces erythrochromogenes TaxID=285574 RepID=UPI00224E60EA|nr:DUF2786 domain-containing protein [Streptomyces erythrochromogenes]MCX5581978.1 DUF2786 domain-containing protein [Streptomyces erythrochromogenes]